MFSQILAGSANHHNHDLHGRLHTENSCRRSDMLGGVADQGRGLGVTKQEADRSTPGPHHRAERANRALLVFVVLVALVTGLGVIVLWPTDEGMAEATAQAGQMGLASERLRGTVMQVQDGPCSYSDSDNPRDCRRISVVLNEGDRAGSVIVLPEFDLDSGGPVPAVVLDQKVIVGYEPSTDHYFYADTDRRTPLIWLSALFALAVIALARRRGVLALLGMATTAVVLVGFLAPSVLDGNDPLVVAVVSASAIVLVNLYLVHGFKPMTTVALAGTLSALGLTIALSWAFFELAGFTGLATEEALTLPLLAQDLNIASLILGGAIIGTLGALDDITVTQAALVAELHHRNPDLGVRELVSSGLVVGREHIASTVNTLLLAYAGASIPLFMLLAVSNQSLVMVVNSELIAVEIFRTLCGSMGLVAAVPITTVLAALVTGRTTPSAG